MQNFQQQAEANFLLPIVHDIFSQPGIARDQKGRAHGLDLILRDKIFQLADNE